MGKVSKAERAWLRRGLDQPGGRLPLFATDGAPVPRALIQAALQHGTAEQWFDNPLKPHWLVCRITPLGRAVVLSSGRASARVGQKSAASA